MVTIPNLTSSKQHTFERRMFSQKILISTLLLFFYVSPSHAMSTQTNPTDASSNTTPQPNDAGRVTQLCNNFYDYIYEDELIHDCICPVACPYQCITGDHSIGGCCMPFQYPMCQRLCCCIRCLPWNPNNYEDRRTLRINCSVFTSMFCINPALLLASILSIH